MYFKSIILKSSKFNGYQFKKVEILYRTFRQLLWSLAARQVFIGKKKLIGVLCKCRCEFSVKSESDSCELWPFPLINYKKFYEADMERSGEGGGGNVGGAISTFKTFKTNHKHTWAGIRNAQILHFCRRIQREYETEPWAGAWSRHRVSKSTRYVLTDCTESVIFLFTTTLEKWLFFSLCRGLQ